MYHARIPQVYHQGAMVNVHRLFSELLGQNPPNGGYWSNSCGEPKCVLPEHALHRSETVHLRLMGRKENRSVASEIVRRAKLTEAAKHRRRISDEQLKIIQTSNRSSADLAREFGVSKSLVSIYRRGERARTVNPWQGLVR
jgi:hypothetical protein